MHNKYIMLKRIISANVNDYFVYLYIGLVIVQLLVASQQWIWLEIIHFYNIFQCKIQNFTLTIIDLTTVHSHIIVIEIHHFSLYYTRRMHEEAILLYLDNWIDFISDTFNKCILLCTRSNFIRQTYVKYHIVQFFFLSKSSKG